MRTRDKALQRNNIMISKSSSKLAKSNITSLEKFVGYCVPTDLSDFYLFSNGGVPDKSHFYIEKDDDFVEISLFIPILYTNDDLGGMSVELSYKYLTKIGIPHKYLPFGVDWGGNYFSLDLETGNIVLLLMDLGDFSDKCIKYIAHNFSSFINNLQEHEEEDV